jgi:hypothetical protein
MKWTYALRLAACIAALGAVSKAAAQTSNVMLSMNVFPTNVGNPNGGGAWTIVAKTDSMHGIAGISAYLQNINVAGLDVENDIGHDFADPTVFVLPGGKINIGYGQDITDPTLVGGVGTLSLSDGPDPFGNPAWDDATRIFSGTYSSIVPSFTIAGSNETDANTFAQVIVGLAALNANTTTVVRVAVPEPAAMIGAASALAGLIVLRRRT